MGGGGHSTGSGYDPVAARCKKKTYWPSTQPSSGFTSLSKKTTTVIYMVGKHPLPGRLKHYIPPKNRYISTTPNDVTCINPLNPELNPIYYLLALLGAHHFIHVSRIRVKLLTLRRLMSYIYIYIYIWSTHS